MGGVGIAFAVASVKYASALPCIFVDCGMVIVAAVLQLMLLLVSVEATQRDGAFCSFFAVFRSALR